MIDLRLSPGSLSICTASQSGWKESPAHFAWACDPGCTLLSFNITRGFEQALALREGLSMHNGARMIFLKGKMKHAPPES